VKRRCEMAKLMHRSGFPKVGDYANFHDEMKAQDEALSQLEKESHAAVCAGTAVGLLIKFQVADGYAIYRVAKEKPFTVEYIDYGDGWQAHSATIRGLRLADAQRMAANDFALYQLFEGRRNA
jgi:hypothetical protein